MSSITKGRVKQIKPRQGGSFPASGIPIGTDGLLVDMISQLDLEQEIRLGGNHYVDMIETEIATVIKQWYFTQARNNRTISQMSAANLITYSGRVTITKAVEFNILLPQPEDEDPESPAVTGYHEDFYPYPPDGAYIVTRQDISSNQQRIIMELYRYNMDDSTGVPLHSKTIYLYESEDANQTVIDEQINEQVTQDIINPLGNEEEEEEDNNQEENEG